MKRIGLDLGKRKSWIVGANEKDEVFVDQRIYTTRENLAPFFASFPAGDCVVLMEASTPSEWVARLIESFEHKAIVADPNFGPMYAQVDKRLKTDRRDAHALLRALYLQAFRPAVRRSDAELHIRSMLMSRDALVRTRTKLINRTRATLSRYGIEEEPVSDTSVYTEAVLRVVRSCDVIAELQPTLTVIDTTSREIARFDQMLEAEATRNPDAVRLDKVTGVGLIATLAFINSLGRVERFKSARQVVAYLGLPPSERSSGDNEGFRGRITKRGDPLTRRLLVQSAHSMMFNAKNDETAPLREWALKIAARNGGKKNGGTGKARVALARRIARILYAMWRDKTDFKAELTKPIDGGDKGAGN
jgi:transposase